MVWAIRGAITIDENSAKAVSEGTYELMSEIIRQNQLKEEDVISIVFTATKDINAKYPSAVVRDELSWCTTAMLNYQELDIANSLKLCIRVLLHVNTQRSKQEMKHVYLKNAKVLRPDISK